MASAKDIKIAPISGKDANALVERIHYSGKVAPNSQLHLGVFLNDRLEGAMQFGPSLDKRKTQALVFWNFLEWLFRIESHGFFRSLASQF